MTDVDTPMPTGRRARLLSRRYYPMAVGVGFLGLVVGFFPSTVPTSSLGFVPRLAAPVATTPAPPAASPTPAPSAGGFPSSFGGDASAFGDSLPTDTTPDVPVTSPATTGPAGSGAVGSGSHAICSLPLPAEPPAPPAAALLELLSVAGPLGPEATAGTAALAPVIPIVTPLLPLASGVAGGKSGALLSSTLVQIANLEDEIFGPFSKEITAITPNAVAADEKFFQEIGPLLTLASNLPDLSCVGDLEIAVGAAVDPSGYPGAVALTPAGHNSSSADQRVVTVATSWAEGVTPGFAQAVGALIAQGTPVEIRLMDAAPAGHGSDVEGFASWVSGVVASFPKAAIWEIDPFAATGSLPGAVAPGDPAASLAAGVRAAALTRAPGQLLGFGLPARPAAWLSQLSTALSPAVRGVVNFVGVDATGFNNGIGLSPDGLHWVVSLLRRGALAEAGFPAQMPIFVTAGTGMPMSDAAQDVLAARDAASLAGLGVGLLTWSSPSTAAGRFLADLRNAGNLLGALGRPPAP